MYGIIIDVPVSFSAKGSMPKTSKKSPIISSLVIGQISPVVESFSPHHARPAELLTSFLNNASGFFHFQLALILVLIHIYHYHFLF